MDASFECGDRKFPGPQAMVRVYRLVHQACELGADPHIWRARFLAEISKWIDAAMAMAYVVKTKFDPGDYQPNLLLSVTLGENESWSRFLAQGDVTNDPTTPKIMQRIGTDFTCARQELIDDSTWYSSSHFKKMYESNHVDQTLISQVAIDPPGVVHGMGFVRALGKPAFSAEDVSLVRFVHDELAYLWRRPEPLPLSSLTAREREVLLGIRRGETRKEIANALGVSEHTVHSHEKALFEKGRVNGRGMLLARLAQQVRPSLL